MPWRPLNIPLDCAVCGQPTLTAHITDRMRFDTVVPMVVSWVEPRCKEHAYKLHVKGSCNHGGIMEETERPYVEPSVKVPAKSSRLTTAARLTFFNFTRSSAIDDRHNRRH